MDRNKKIAMFICNGIIAIIEIVIMIYDCKTAFINNAFMVLLSIPDTLFAFSRKKEYKWWNFTFLSLFIVLTIISYICASYI